MLLAFIALVALVNGLLSGMLGWIGLERVGPDGRPDALQWVLGKLLTPLALLLGTGPEDAPSVARFLGVGVGRPQPVVPAAHGAWREVQLQLAHGRRGRGV